MKAKNIIVVSDRKEMRRVIEARLRPMQKILAGFPSSAADPPLSESDKMFMRLLRDGSVSLTLPRSIAEWAAEDSV